MTIRRIIHVAKIVKVAGMERHLLALLPGLKARGLEVSMLVLVEPDKPMTGYIAEMNALGIPTDSLIMTSDFAPGLIRRLVQHFRGADAVHTHLIHADLHGVIAARLAGIRHIFFSCHNDDRFRHYLPVRLVQGLLWRQVEAGIAISEALRRFVIQVEFAPPERAHTVHYGLEPTAFDPGVRDQLRTELGIGPRTPLVGSLCRLVPQKGLTYAIDALAQVPGCHYAILGDGPLEQTLQAQVNMLNLQNRVHFLGWRGNARDLLPAFDVMLIPSLWEGFGLVALEAMAARLPIIAANVSALPEIVADGETGCLVPPADSGMLAARLRGLIDHPDQAQMMGQNGRQRLEQQFSVRRMVESTLRIYGRADLAW